MGENPIWKAAAMADHFEKIQKLLIPSLELLTSAVFPVIRSTAVVNPPSPGWKLHLRKLLEASTPRMVRSSGSTSARSQACMSTVNHSVLAHQTRLVSMLSLETSLVI